MNFSSDLTAVLSLANCAKTQSISRKVSQHSTMHVAISDIGCQRPDWDTSMLVPVVSPGTALLQLLADLRYARIKI